MYWNDNNSLLQALELLDVRYCNDYNCLL